MAAKSSFVNEHINKLNSALSSVLQTQDLPEILQVQDGTKASPQDALNEGRPDLFLTLACQAIDLSSTYSLPNVQTVGSYLAMYKTARTPSNETLEWLFLAKCALAIYGNVLDKLLNSTVPLAQSIGYWNNVYGSSLREAYYALQTAPLRFASLATTTVQAMRTTQLGLGSFVYSSEHWINSLFPNQHRRSLAGSRNGARFRLFSAKRPFLAQMIHEEIGSKKRELEQIRTQQAIRLGLMIKMAPVFEQKDMSAVAQETTRCLQLLDHVLRPLCGPDANPLARINSESVLHALAAKSGHLEHAHNIAQMLSDMVESWPNYQSAMDSVHDVYRPPSGLTRYWIPGILVYVASKSVANIIFDRKDDIIRWTHELANTARDFVINWIWEPVLKVWDTVRLKEDERLGLLSKDGLRSDLESLERMVVQFATDHYQLPPSQIPRLTEDIRHGDLSLVLKAYEREIKQPLKNAITGDLIQTLLIQVQKTKVDVDLAMAALDKLLKSNELNFAFLAVAPSMLVMWASITWIKNCFQRRSGRNSGKIGQPIRDSMRRVERLFNLANTTSNNSGTTSSHGYLDCESQGLLLCEVHLLRTYSQQLPNRNSIRELFLQDLRDLENAQLTLSQRLDTVTRMRRTWAFLQPRQIYGQ